MFHRGQFFYIRKSCLCKTFGKRGLQQSFIQCVDGVDRLQFAILQNYTQRVSSVTPYLFEQNDFFRIQILLCITKTFGLYFSEFKL